MKTTIKDDERKVLTFDTEGLATLEYVYVAIEDASGRYFVEVPLDELLSAVGALEHARDLGRYREEHFTELERK